MSFSVGYFEISPVKREFRHQISLRRVVYHPWSILDTLFGQWVAMELLFSIFLRDIRKSLPTFVWTIKETTFYLKMND